jgi:hypothetical protein
VKLFGPAEMMLSVLSLSGKWVEALSPSSDVRPNVDEDFLG